MNFIKYFLTAFILLAIQNVSFAQQDTIFRSFSVTQAEKGVLISFTIKGGITCSGVKVERSTDKLKFDEIHEFAGVCGAINTDESYVFTDSNPVINQIAWYRLDLGSLGWYSALVDVKYIEYNSGGITIFPNPCNENCTVYFSNNTLVEHELVVFNALGKLILSDKINGESASFSTYGLPHGIYFLRLYKNEEERYSTKVLIY
jgi:hypothetical protein